MIAAALVMATVSSGRSMLAHQWLLIKALDAEKHLTYSIFLSQPDSNSNGLL
jgi:hypothetical protein